MKRLVLAASIAFAMTCFGQTTSSPSSTTPDNSAQSTANPQQTQPATTPDQSTAKPDQSQPATTPDQSTTNSQSTTSSSTSTTDQGSAASANPQSDQPQDQSTSGTAQAEPAHKGHHKGAAASGGSKTLTGCIESKDGQYWLKTAHGNYHLMSSQDLSAHVGHEVKATGTASMGPAPGGDNASASASDTGKAKAGKNVHHLEVTDLQMVSEQCNMGKSASHKSKKGAAATSNPS